MITEVPLCRSEGIKVPTSVIPYLCYGSAKVGYGSHFRYQRALRLSVSVLTLSSFAAFSMELTP